MRVPFFVALVTTCERIRFILRLIRIYDNVEPTTPNYVNIHLNKRIVLIADCYALVVKDTYVYV